jgi:uncharacterized protein with GYD domain
MDDKKTTINSPDTESVQNGKDTAFFLVQGTYSSYTWIYRTTKDSDDFKRPPDLMGVFLELGVKVHGIWYSFGEYDFTGIIEFEKTDDGAAMAIAMRAGWDGKAFDTIKLTPLLTQDQAAEACLKASKGLKKSRDASKEGPLTGTKDYSDADFKKEQK